MLQVPEIVRAMGFDRPLDGIMFRLEHGTRRERIRFLGNAVCPPIMERIVQHLATSEKEPSPPRSPDATMI